jgi:hypothetical protein
MRDDERELRAVEIMILVAFVIVVASFGVFFWIRLSEGP